MELILIVHLVQFILPLNAFSEILGRSGAMTSMPCQSHWPETAFLEPENAVNFSKEFKNVKFMYDPLKSVSVSFDKDYQIDADFECDTKDFECIRGFKLVKTINPEASIQREIDMATNQLVETTLNCPAVPKRLLKPGYYKAEHLAIQPTATHPGGILTYTLDISADRSKVIHRAGFGGQIYTFTYKVVKTEVKEKTRRGLQEITSVIKSKLDQVRFCYKTAVVIVPNLEGKLEVSWKVMPSGKVEMVHIKSRKFVPDIKSATQMLESCIIEKIRMWIFIPNKGTEVQSVTYPFIFNPI
jgi:hypothetical protein